MCVYHANLFNFQTLIFLIDIYMWIRLHVFDITK